MLNTVDDRHSDRLLGFGNRNASVRGIRLPSDRRRSFRFVEAGGPDLKFVETAVVRFNARHPYLLFNEHAIPWVRGRANSQSKLITRLKTSLSEVGFELDQTRAARQDQAPGALPDTHGVFGVDQRRRD